MSNHPPRNGRRRRVPTIRAVMTTFPWTIQVDDLLEHAKRVMSEHEIRHLPVTESGKLVGVITERDIRLVEEATARAEAAAAPLAVRDACHFDVYVAEDSEPLDRVLAEMARRRIGSALVAKRDKLVGIFTSTDACFHFAKYLRRETDEPDDVVA